MYINNEIARPGLSTNGSAQTAGRPAGRLGSPWLARLGVVGLDLAPQTATRAPKKAEWASNMVSMEFKMAHSAFKSKDRRLDWLDMAAPGALAGSIWPRLARSGCPWRPGWLELALLGVLAGSIWLLWSLLGALPGHRKPKRLAFRLSASMLPASCALERFLMPQI